ncbi:hypothetical protein BS50DRAFT_584229 [Corynespora cassiicola Philippines]|uniref:Uncharacterized protein n=1 Tax=Corynespora cassiicola Philippines TaxID=1448308 RepID=A0A2T2NZC3_CORCC|nr:hypothetical protein BS50DRAFT_584229 [Corynespora cassiicola Philippines]
MAKKTIPFALLQLLHALLGPNRTPAAPDRTPAPDNAPASNNTPAPGNTPAPDDTPASDNTPAPDHMRADDDMPGIPVTENSSERPIELLPMSTPSQPPPIQNHPAPPLPAPTLQNNGTPSAIDITGMYKERNVSENGTVKHHGEARDWRNKGTEQTRSRRHLVHTRVLRGHPRSQVRRRTERRNAIMNHYRQARNSRFRKTNQWKFRRYIVHTWVSEGYPQFQVRRKYTKIGSLPR